MDKIVTKFWKFNLTMGLYGFTRGYRSKDSNNKPILMGDKICKGLINSYVYMIPLFNLKFIFNLANRLEITYKCLDKNEYKESFEEGYVGREYCEDII